MSEEIFFSPGDDFEETLRKVEESMDEPGFVEAVNRTVITNAHLDGQRLYSQKEVDQFNSDLEEGRSEGTTFEPGRIHDLIGKGLAQATDNFSKRGTVKLNGDSVYDMADSIYHAIIRNGMPLNLMSKFVEIVVAGSLGIGYGLKFEDYRTDIVLLGRGFLPDTYSLQIDFNPIRKNITSADVV